MKRVYSNKGEVKHLFCNQWVFEEKLGGYRALHMVSVPDTARASSIRYEPMGMFAPHPLRTDNLKRYSHVDLDEDTTSTPPSVLYSFHTPIAVLFPEKKVAVITSTSFSSYTARHMIHWNDLSGGWTVVHACLDKQDATPERGFVQGRGGISRYTEPQDWVNEQLYYAEQLVKKTAAPRTRKATNEGRIASAQGHHARAVELAAKFGCPVPPPLELDGKVLTTREEAAKKAREEAAAAARKEAQLKREADRLRDLPHNMELLLAWRMGAQWPWGLDVRLAAPGTEPQTYLRVIGKQVETSRGARIPVADAAAAWPMLQALHNADAGADTTTRIANRWEAKFKFGVYPFTSYDGQTLVVGCHEIDYSELELIAPAVLAAVQGGPAQEPTAITTNGEPA